MLATCLTIASILANARGGETINFAGQSCGSLVIKRTYNRPVTVLASGTLVKGLVITGGGVHWRSGTITAAGGLRGRGPNGYGALLRGANNVRFDGVLFTDADRGMVIDKARHVAVVNSRFSGLGSDGIIGSDSQGVLIDGNTFADTRPVPTQCSAENRVIQSLPRRECDKLGGVWKDGSHADAVQLRNNMIDVVLINNDVTGQTQGLTQMDTTGDLPLQRVRIEKNRIETDGPHKISLSTCLDCQIRWNVLKRPKGSRWKAVILPGSGLMCGNITERPEPKC